MAQRELLSPQELAELVGVPLRTVYTWNYSGDGPPRMKIGRHVRYRRSEVERWLDSRVDPGRPAA